MKNLLLLLMFAPFALYAPTNNSTYSYCGFHDNNFSFTAYHWNSEFWVDMLVTEARKWNDVHSVLSVGRTRSSTIHVGRDNRNVIGWIAEADLNNFYGLSWSSAVGWTISWSDGSCGNIIEADIFFNPGISLFVQQTSVPYNLGYQEIALHELGHSLTLDHEDGSLSIMTAGAAVSNVLHHNDKVGWLRSADFRFSVTDRLDMGVFPLRNNGANKIFSTISPSTVRPGSNLTINNITVENLSSGLTFSNPIYDVVMESSSGTNTANIGSFFWGSFGPFSQWSGNLSWRVPSSLSPGIYQIKIIARNSDSDSSNNTAVIGSITVI